MVGQSFVLFNTNFAVGNFQPIVEKLQLLPHPNFSNCTLRGVNVYLYLTYMYFDLCLVAAVGTYCIRHRPFVSIQLCFVRPPPSSSIAVLGSFCPRFLSPVFLGRRLPLWPCGVHCSACLVMPLSFVLNVSPSQFQSIIHLCDNVRVQLEEVDRLCGVTCAAAPCGRRPKDLRFSAFDCTPASGPRAARAAAATWNWPPSVSSL